jgi:hypothetical protein
MIKILNSEKIMSLIEDWRTFFLFTLSLLPFINSLNIIQKNHTGFTTNYKTAEKYQLLGGESW